jgi:hypothetical protein
MFAQEPNPANYPIVKDFWQSIKDKDGAIIVEDIA